ncbi:MAG: tRNA 2-thiouridine(34) synthase MnmA [Clostridia bacterium]|nr:tRNA 2-thiouridine(34) synthase MnmA [Clostridia bacterium]
MRIVVGMSGGVDSSVAAYLLKQQGHEVIGVFMNNWEEDGVCTSEQDFADVRAVCDVIGIPYYSVSFAKEYMDRVFTHFLEEYRRGRTPNPDVMCNREIKFASLLELSLSLGADKLATGHFAGVSLGVDGKYHLLRAKDENKDQTYFLCTVTQAQLSKALFPLTELTKAEIRQIAQESGIPVYQKKDSTGVCFIGERNFKKFLSGYLPAQPGDIYSVEGEKVGRHDGLMYYTLGQRRGLGIGGRGSCERWFVVDKDLEHNRLIVSQGAESALLFTGEGTAENVSWIADVPPIAPGESLSCKARFRHRQPLQDVTIRLSGENVSIRYAQPQRAVTPGQAVAFYINDECLGGGTISESHRR